MFNTLHQDNKSSHQTNMSTHKLTHMVDLVAVNWYLINISINPTRGTLYFTELCMKINLVH